jgi:23S rRNA (uracil1939-C5)-methyltransferase
MREALQKNQVAQAEITDLTAEGNGVCHIQGMAVFVPHTVPGDVVQVKIVKVQKQYAFGIVTEMVQPAPDRIEPDCPYTACGGCTVQHMTYAAELTWKANLVQAAFQRIGKLQPTFLPIIGGEQQCHYRNKAQYPLAINSEGKPVCGFYAKRSHRVIPVRNCKLQPVIFQEIIDVVLDYIAEKKLSVYREETGTGVLRHLYLRQGWHTGEIMVCLVVRKPIGRQLQGLCGRLTAAFPQIKSIVMNCNPARTNVILGDKNEVLWGTETITDILCGNRISISPHAFYQINTEQTERLYCIAKTFADLHGTERVLDLYCGAGTIGLSMADQAASVLGVEIVPQAVENAKENAKQSGISNADFLCGDAGEVAQKLEAEQVQPDVIVVDPPRKGCDGAALDAIGKMQPKRVVMVSCNPATAARDCAILQEKGYVVQKVQPVDLFPRTGHVECVVGMERVEI